MASIRKRGSIWWIKYYVGGEAISRSLKTRNAREARKICEQYSAAEKVDLLVKPSSTPIGPFLQSLCEYWRKTRKGKGAASDIGRLRQFFGPACKALKYRERTEAKYKKDPPKGPKHRDGKTGMMIPVKRLEQLTPQIITTILRQRFFHAGITGRTVNRYRGVLSSMFTYARKHHGYICPDRRYKNPIEGVERFPEKKRAITWLGTKQIDEQLAALEGYPQLRAMVAVAVFSGPRREAITWLTPEDVDLEQRILHIRAKEIDGECWETKTGKDRAIPISSRLHEILTVYRPSVPSRWFFPSPQGQRWHPDNFSLKLREINDAHDLRWSCMDYRHTFGSHLAMKGVSLYKISALMGNSPEICRRHYAALLPHEMREEVEFATGEKVEGPPPDDDPTQAMLRELLEKVDRIKGDGSPDRRRLRIVR